MMLKIFIIVLKKKKKKANQLNKIGLTLTRLNYLNLPSKFVFFFRFVYVVIVLMVYCFLIDCNVICFYLKKKIIVRGY